MKTPQDIASMTPQDIASIWASKAPSGYEDDVRQAGLIGAWKASLKALPGIRGEAYVRMRTKNACIDELRRIKGVSKYRPEAFVSLDRCYDFVRIGDDE